MAKRQSKWCKVVCNPGAVSLTGRQMTSIAKNFGGTVIAVTSYPMTHEKSKYFQDQWNTSWSYEPRVILRGDDGTFHAVIIPRGESPMAKAIPLWYDGTVPASISGVYFNGTFAYSTCRHDFWQPEGFPVAVDGGRDYVRFVGDIHAVKQATLDLRTGAVTAALDAPTIVGHIRPNWFNIFKRSK